MSTEPHVIPGADIVSVWKTAFRSLVTDGNRFNLVLHVEHPLVQSADELMALDPHSVDSKARPLFDVANTIFPARSARWDSPVGEFVRYYGIAYERLLKKGVRSWGCYFKRLISFGDDKIDQLDLIIRGLGTWGHAHKAAFVVHFSSSTSDKPRPQGAPCLQYVQFSVSAGNVLSLTAVYRSHDYFYKTLGNLVGLSRLLEYVAVKTKHEVGTLTCLSTYAFVDASARNVAALSERVDA
jgi:thymidylate synthase